MATNKMVIAICKEVYRGVSLYETMYGGIAFCLSRNCYEVGTVKQAVTLIDGWYALKIK